MNFLGGLLEALEDAGRNFSERAYEVVGDEIMPLLTIMLIAYVAYYGLQLVMGTARVSVGEIVDRFGTRAFGALLFIFALPNLLPLPPGSSTVLGAPLLLLAPQVAARMSGCVLERGSLAGRLWCGVWQSEHMAAEPWPTDEALPWKLSWNDL